MDSEKLEQLKATGDLPSPKGAALAIIRLTQKDDVSSSDLEHAIKADPAFVGRLLKAANAGGRNGGRPVVSIQDALIVLGIAVVRNLALSFSLVSNYRAGHCKGFDYDLYWSRSLLLGLAFQEVVRKAGVANPEEAFCCGLLADVGRLALATLYPREYTALLVDLGRAGKSQEVVALHAAEREAFAIDSRAMTTAMLADWGLPQIFIEPIGHRHDTNHSTSVFPADSRPARLLQALHMAEAMAHACLTPESERRAQLERVTALGALFSFDAEAVYALCDRVARLWLDWGAMLAIHAEPMKPFAALAESTEDEALGDLALDKASQPLRVLLLGVAGESGESLLRALETAGHQVLSAVDEEEAINIVLDVHPQLAIVDWELPGAAAATFVRALRQTRIGRGVYVLALVAAAPGEQAGSDEERLVAAFDTGVDDCLNKPLSSRMLTARLKAAQRVIGMQLEIERDRAEIRNFAAELAVSNRRLHEVALTDALTGFFNRRYATERLDKEWAASVRSGRPLACMLVDLDNFKQVNDLYGHDVGDALLVELAQAMKAALRSNDVICRMGGDEFLIISPDTDEKAVRLCAERLLATAAARTVPTGDGRKQIGVSVSIGMATRSSDKSPANVAALVKAADEAMYRAKLAGRNKISD